MINWTLVNTFFTYHQINKMEDKTCCFLVSPIIVVLLTQEKVLKVHGNISCFFCHYLKRRHLCDFLFVSLRYKGCNAML